jgi:hypothetical protein
MPVMKRFFALVGESFVLSGRLYEHGLQRVSKKDMSEMNVGRAVIGLLLLLAIASVPIQLLAQDDETNARPAFAGGHMVRGSVTAVTGDHVTVKTDTGDIFQVVVSANTRLSKDRQPVKVGDIKVGDGVGAMGVLDAPTKTVHAVFVGVLDAEQVKKAREDLGKVYIAGRVTAIDMDTLKLTVARPDGVNQVIGVDEGTSFKRGGRQMAAMVNGSGEMGSGRVDGPGIGSTGESITLADLKVGDSIAGRGALKNGLFVPTELRVMDAAARSQRRRRAAEGGASPATTPVAPQ